MGRRDAFSVSTFFQGLVKAVCNFSTKSERRSFVGLVVREAGVPSAPANEKMDLNHFSGFDLR